MEKRKVTVKLTFTEPSPTRPASRTNIPRPVSPLAKQRAKVTPSASDRKFANSVSNVSHVGSAVPPRTKGRPGTSDGPSSRPGSPTKLRTALSPHARAQTAAGHRPATPHLRHRSQTSSSTDLRNPESRNRSTAAPLHHTLSHSSLLASNLSSASSYSPDTGAYSDTDSGRYSPSVRVTAKVTGIVKSNSNSLSPTIASQAVIPNPRPKTHSPRSPSTSSITAPSQSPPVFYPITTATPAANPHRYPANRSPPQIAHHHYQPFSPPNNLNSVTQPRRNGVARVDPATIPLPASSPPASALSVSSRSSVSYTANSVTSGSSQHTHPSGDPDPLRSTLGQLVHFKELIQDEDNISGDTDTEPYDNTTAERKVRAEAKSNRKIADLEITNRSLLAINASLESQKHKQAKEIRELRRKLRESRLILPPPTYQVVKSSLDHDDTAEDDDDDDNDGDDDISNNEGDGDEVYLRIKIILEGLLESGRRALQRKSQELLPAGGGTKVLSADEVRTWRDSSGGRSDHTALPHFGTDDTLGSIQLSPSFVALDVLSDSDEDVNVSLAPVLDITDIDY